MMKRNNGDLLVEISKQVSGISVEIPNIKQRLEEHGVLINDIRNIVVEEKGKTQHNFDMISGHIGIHQIEEKRKSSNMGKHLSIAGLCIATVSALGGILWIFL